MSKGLELPEGWEASTFSELFERLQYGYTAKAQKTSKGPKFLRITDLSEDGIDWSTVPTCSVDPKSLGKYLLSHGDFVFARTGSIEKAARVKNPPVAVFASYLIRGQLQIPEVSSWLEYFILSHQYLLQIDAAGAGTGRSNVNAKKLGKVTLPIPPLAEQRRIVAKLEALEAQRRAAKSKLERLPALLNQYRQSLLAAAFRGDLTAAWREANPATEPASALLDTIRAERRRRWIEAAAEKATARAEARDQKKGRPAWTPEQRTARLAKEHTKATAKYQPPAPVDNTDLPELPEGWVWASVDEMAELITKGASPRWQGFEYISEGVPYVRSQNVLWGKLNATDLVYLEPSFNDLQPRSVLREQDVLLNIVGASIGRAAIASQEVAGGNTNQAVALIRYINSPLWLLFWLLSPLCQRQIHYTKVDVARANLSLSDIASLLVPVAPQDEQDEVKRLLEEGLARIEQLEATVAAQIEQLDVLQQAMLAKVFRGELVPTEAEIARREGRAYEDAAALLARLQHEAKPRPRTRKRRTSQTAPPAPEPLVQANGQTVLPFE